MRNHVRTSKWSDKPASKEDIQLQARMKAKLLGFLEQPERVLQIYRKEDQTIQARYDRAIAHHRALRFDVAIDEIDRLIADYPDDPYFHETKGQILFENGQLIDALPYYEAANRYLPNQPVLMFELARLGIELDDPALLENSILALEHIVRVETDNNAAWWLLSIGYGRAGRLADSALASGEQAILEGRVKDAIFQAERAARSASTGSPIWLRAKELEEVATRRRNRPGR